MVRFFSVEQIDFFFFFYSPCASTRLYKPGARLLSSSQSKRRCPPLCHLDQSRIPGEFSSPVCLKKFDYKSTVFFYKRQGEKISSVFPSTFNSFSYFYNTEKDEEEEEKEGEAIEVLIKRIEKLTVYFQYPKILDDVARHVEILHSAIQTFFRVVFGRDKDQNALRRVLVGREL